MAKPLNLGIAEAAFSVIEAAVGIIEKAIREALASAEFESEGFSIFCFGGNGGNFASLVAQRLGLESAYVFKLGPVLSAFGSSLSSISHVQEEWPYLSVGDNKDRARLSQVVEGAKQRVLRDLEGEGLEPERLSSLLRSRWLTVAGRETCGQSRRSWKTHSRGIAARAPRISMH